MNVAVGKLISVLTHTHTPTHTIYAHIQKKIHYICASGLLRRCPAALHCLTEQEDYFWGWSWGVMWWQLLTQQIVGGGMTIFKYFGGSRTLLTYIGTVSQIFNIKSI